MSFRTHLPRLKLVFILINASCSCAYSLRESLERFLGGWPGHWGEKSAADVRSNGWAQLPLVVVGASCGQQCNPASLTLWLAVIVETVELGTAEFCCACREKDPVSGMRGPRSRRYLTRKLVLIRS